MSSGTGLVVGPGRIGNMFAERDGDPSGVGQDPGRDTIELAGAIEAFTSQRLARADN